jgi:hypothetical protein
MARAQRGGSLGEDLYEALRSDIRFGRRLPSSRPPLDELATTGSKDVDAVVEDLGRRS